jgi:hypothetical protein
MSDAAKQVSNFRADWQWKWGIGAARVCYNAAMRRFGRWTFNGLAVVSLVLGVAMVVLWARGRQAIWESQLSFGQRHYVIVFCEGRIGFLELPPGVWSSLMGSPHNSQRFLSFSVTNREARAITTRIQLQRLQAIESIRGYLDMYGWRVSRLAATFLAVTALLLLVRWTCAHRPLPGFCHRCSYDLTANVSGVCPECGTPISN